MKKGGKLYCHGHWNLLSDCSIDIMRLALNDAHLAGLGIWRRTRRGNEACRHSNQYTVRCPRTMFEEGEGEERVGSYVIFLAEGETLAKQGEYSKAIGSFTKVFWPLRFYPLFQASLYAGMSGTRV